MVVNHYSRHLKISPLPFRLVLAVGGEFDTPSVQPLTQKVLLGPVKRENGSK